MIDTTTTLSSSETVNVQSIAARSFFGRIVHTVVQARAAARTFFRSLNSGLTKQSAVSHSNVDLMNRFETLALFAVFRLEANARGVAILRLIEETTKQRINVRKLYAALKSLENRG